MSGNGSGNMYGVIGQPLTPDYLAKQLPLFQPKVPKNTLKSIKFTTNAPSNLPVPELYPGEEVLLQEHRIVCMDAFNEPAVGAVYFTNFRVIFCGNAISDPESIDALQSASYSQTGRFKDLSTLGGEFSSKLKDKFVRKSEANFHSFLYPDQVDGETGNLEKNRTRHSQRIVNIKKKIGSLRRPRTKTATLPPPSHPPPILDPSQFSSPPPTTLDEEFKRRGVNYDAETASLDSTSASSQSEFSSTTGTDERSLQSPLREVCSGTTTPIDIDGVGSHSQTDGYLSPTVLIPDSGFKGDSSLEATVCSNNYQLMDSGINFMEDRGSTSGAAGATPTISVVSDRSPLPQAKIEDIDSSNVNSLNSGSERRILTKAMSLDSSAVTSNSKSLQRSYTVDDPGSSLNVRRSKKFWENSIVIIESDSDSEACASPSDNSSFNSANSPQSTTQPTSGNKEDKDEELVATANAKILSPKRRPPPPIPTNIDSLPSPTTNDSQQDKENLGLPSSRSDRAPGSEIPCYTNMQVLSEASLLNDHRRKRSKSTSPLIPRKPKPLPRLLSKGRGELVTSLPSDFKPVPPLKPAKFFTSDVDRAILSPPPEESTPSSDTTQSSPEHHGNSSDPPPEGNSLALPTRNEKERGVSPVPVAPPRRKRKTKHGKPKTSSSRTKENGSCDQNRMQEQRVNGSHDQTNDFPDHLPTMVNGSHDPIDRDEKENTEVDLEDQSQREYSESDQNRLSTRTSLAVHPSSRPHSIMSPSMNSDLTFSLEIERGSPAYSTMPSRTVASTWSPKSDLLKKKSAIPSSTRYTLCVSFPLYSIHSVTKLQSVALKEQGLKLPDGILILCRTAHSLRLHIHPHNTYDAEALRELLEKKFILPKPLHELFAFQYSAAIRHPNPTFIGNRSIPSFFKLPAELQRLGLLDSKLWRVARIIQDHPDICPTYPPHLIMPICIPDLDIIRGTSLYKEGRFPTLTWLHPSGAALLRGAATKEERGQGTVNQQTDEALLRAICASNSNSKGPATLCVFTEKGVSDNKHPTLKPDEVRTYYYHGCKFIYSEAPPTFKSVRHSFNKLQALLENKLPDEDYLLALDSTKWLQRIGELLSIANSVVRALSTQQAHVLVCFESGWDRTTQITSLAQLLVDPFYRTMDGFQILIQKEWVWFGHPFRARHSSHGRTKAKTDGPIFLQWLDCVWQVMNQCPSAFEFNEKFLMSLAEESYSGRFGTFMTDCEQIRKQMFSVKGYEHMSISTHTVSYWTWVAMVNSVERTFFNDLYDPMCYPSVIVPAHSVPRLKLWTSNYCRYKTQEFTYRPSIVQRQLEELLNTYKKLNAFRASLENENSTPLISDVVAVPPPLFPRDELFERSLKEHHCPSAVRSKPTPPLKPTTHKPHFDSIKQYLLSEGLDPSICKHVELGQTICQGSLLKIGAKRKNWLQRWFVLDFDCQYLAYFENKMAYENREAPKGVIRLSDINKVYQNMNKRDHLMKHIVTIETSQRTYLIQAPSISSMDIWQTCLTIPADSFDSRTT